MVECMKMSIANSIIRLLQQQAQEQHFQAGKTCLAAGWAAGDG